MWVLLVLLLWVWLFFFSVAENMQVSNFHAVIIDYCAPKKYLELIIIYQICWTQHLIYFKHYRQFEKN